jgi:hypothetical protein
VKDWTELLVDPLASRLAATLRGLPFAGMQRIPPPKSGGLPFGHELRILARRWRGASSLLDESGLSRLYQALAKPDERRLFRAFVLGDPLSEPEWGETIGREEASRWAAQGLLEAQGDGRLRCRFLALALDDLLLVVDPPEPPVGPRVYIGQDSLLFVEFLSRRLGASCGRALDVGTGSGVILLANARRCAESYGVEINARAARVARFNARLNGRDCEIREGDVFELAGALGRFDLVTWNLPFVFLPEGRRSLEGYGGHLGIELTLRFVETLPDLLAATGQCFLYTTTPVLDDGSNALLEALRPRLDRGRLDGVMSVLQWYWPSGEVGAWHREHGIDHVETVILRLRPGSGRLVREERSWRVRVVDRVRGVLRRS